MLIVIENHSQVSNVVYLARKSLGYFYQFFSVLGCKASSHPLSAIRVMLNELATITNMKTVKNKNI